MRLFHHLLLTAATPLTTRTVGAQPTFTRVTTGPIVTDGGNAAAWSDYDDDEVLDLFVANYHGQDTVLPPPDKARTARG